MKSVQRAMIISSRSLWNYAVIAIVSLQLFACSMRSSERIFTKSEIKQHFVPQVNEINLEEGRSFYLRDLNSIGCTNELIPTANYLVEKLSKLMRVKIDVANKGDITLCINPSLSKEEYTLQVKDNKVAIDGGSTSAVYYGIQTFLQLLPPSVFSDDTIKENELKLVTLPSVTIKDKPHFAYRGMMLDVSRHFMPFPLLLKYVDVLSQHKMNTLHLHLADSQGWRIEIKSHPELMNIGSVRGISEKISPYRHKKAKNWQPEDADPYGPFYYTQEQIKTLVKYASLRGVSIIPEIDVPGHSTALNRSLGLGCCPHPFEGDVVCASNLNSLKVLDDIFTEIATIFPSPYIHFGGDEVRFSQWKKCPKCQKYMKDHQLKDEKALQNDFVHHITEMLHSKGKNPIGWNEILLGGDLPKGTMIMSWEGVAPGIEAAQRDIDVIMAPGPYCYFDMKESNNKNEPGHTWAGVVTLEDVYNYNPLWDIPSAYQNNIKGVSGALWSEFVVPEEIQFWYKSYPRICALAEVGWTNSSNKAFRSFMDRLGLYHLNRLDYQDISYRIPRAIPYWRGTDSIYFKKPYIEAKVRYSEDGSSPLTNGLKYTKMFKCRNRSKFEYVTYSPMGRASVCTSKDIFIEPIITFTYEDLKLHCTKKGLESNTTYQIEIVIDKGVKSVSTLTYRTSNESKGKTQKLTLYPKRTKKIKVKTNQEGMLIIDMKFNKALRSRGKVYLKKS
ncbi:beta-N-acetylhexosaminidase [Halosquirtibacter xylanolyticus]|uniref:family 20 glycosylhydrolase n=1 Tax=Halosquirtibacter xylanolyticus TaxID=3374599 RepID=UPI00374807FA|nr:beta-N-acetylhexosaminidase [Prolixibacteraceae bacterium]